MTTIHLERLPDGSLMNWGRHWRLFGVKPEQCGGAVIYMGEDAKIMELVLKYSKAQKGCE